MKSKTKKYPCGHCLKNIGKSSQAVLCRGMCTQWYHVKCTSLSQSEYENVSKKYKKWTCVKCMSVDVTSGIENEEIEINNDVAEEIETQSEIIKTLTNDLKEANEIIKNLKSHIIQLETMVLKKEETIIVLENKLSALNNITKKSDFSEVVRGYSGQKNNNLPLIHYSQTTKETGNIIPNSKENKCFAMDVKAKKTNKSKEPEIEKPNFSTNKIEVLITGEKEIPTIGSSNINMNNGTSNPTTSPGENMRKMLICADSHGRDLAWHINKSQKTYEAVGYVQPGGRTKQILAKRNVEEANLTKDDVLVICCGTNDVAKNEADQVIEGITNIMDTVKQTNVIVINLPKRYDLPEWSCVNREVIKTNQQLKELCDKYGNVSLVEASKAERHLHTNQGLHLNYRGKKWLAKLVTGAAARTSELRQQPPPPGIESPSENIFRHAVNNPQSYRMLTGAESQSENSTPPTPHPQH